MRLRSVLSLVLVVSVLAGFLAVAEQGPFADSVIYGTRTQEEIALQDVAAGNLDIFQYTTAGSVVFGLDQATLDKLELYVVPASSESYFFNPYPDEAPYIAVTTSGEEYFNPFAIQEVRFAMHFLFNRQQAVDEILQGAGTPSILAVAPDEPGAYRLYLVAQKLGLTNEGDEARAIQMVTDAMTAAAALPENQGRLALGADGFWTFDGQPVTINFLIRADDPSIRLPESRYFANQIEKCGIKVNRVERNRSYCVSTAYLTDPADYQWNIYSEGWLAGGTSLYKEWTITQMYAPWYTNMPGIGETSWWNYSDPEMDAWSQQLVYGQFETVDQYWDLMSKMTERGLTENVRMYLQMDNSYYAANKSAFEGRFLYGLGDGINRYSIYSMIPTNNDRPVRIAQFSSQGALFLNAWDPVGTQGFNDAYAQNVISSCTDSEVAWAPGSAKATPSVESWKDVDVQVEFDADGNGVGQITVPADAVEWDSTAKAWVSTAGQISWAKGTYTVTKMNFQDGTPLTLLDFAAAEGFLRDWATEDYAGDPYYDSAYSSNFTPGFDYSHGGIYDWANGTITNYFDYNFPPDLDYVAASGVATLYPTGFSGDQGVKWTIMEALGKLVAEGSASGTQYGFTPVSGVTEPDLLVPSIVADIRAKLVEMRDSKFVPAYLTPVLSKAGVTVDDIAGYYQAAIDFIDAHGHAYDSNGGYIIDSFDPVNNQMTLKANRDPQYPWDGQYWYDTFEVATARVDSVEPPMAAVAGQDVTVTIRASEATYPFDVFEPASKAAVSLIFVGPNGQTTVDGTMVSAGTFEVVIPGSATAGLSGAYTIVAIAQPEGGLPAATGSTLLLQ